MNAFLSRYLFRTILLTTCLLLPAPPSQANEMVDMVLELLADRDMREAAIEVIRGPDAPGAEATKRFADSLPTLPPDTQVGVILALADRGDIAAKPAIIAALQSTEPTVKVAAVRALAKLGSNDDVSRLATLLADSGAVQAAAKDSLTQIQGPDITQTLAGQLANEPPAIQTQLLNILAERRALDTVPAMLTSAQGQEATVRQAAMQALGQIADPQLIPQLLPCVVKAEPGKERAAAERELAKVCQRIPDPDARATTLLQAVSTLPATDQTAMLVAVGRVGGGPALPVILAAVADDHPQTHNAGVAALANWPDASAAEHLMALAVNAPHLKHQRAALRALLRIAPLDDGRTPQTRLEMLRSVMTMCVRVEDRQYALRRAGAIRIPESLRWVVPYVDDPLYTEAACEAIVNLAHIRDLRDANKVEFHAALDKVLATSRNEISLQRADRYKKGQTWVRE